MSDADEAVMCETVGCENAPVEGGYCAECADISPGILDDDSRETTKESTVEGQTAAANPCRETGESGAREAFAAAVDWFHAHLDREIGDHGERGENEHSDRPTTAREYFREVRGWTDATLDEALLGYAPANRTGLLDRLMREGHDREAILGTGLFTEDLRPLWQGRYVLPYLDENGEPVYAISRATGEVGGGAVGYDGHPADGMSGKYAKPAHSKPYARVNEPIFGLGSVEDGEPVLITEGIADAITAHQAGYPCISPVTTRFKHNDREALREVLDAHDIPRAYVIGDAERPGSDLDDEDRLTLSQVGEGLDGALDTAAHLAQDGVDARVAELPRPGLDKVDLDDYLRGWATDGALDTVLASAKPAEQHPEYDPEERAMQTAAGGLERERERSTGDESDGDHSALFDLDIRDVTGRSWGARGVNPLGHHGDSENYYVLVEKYGVGYDHKHKVAYNALTHLLVEARERRAESPNGRLDDGEVLAAWIEAKDERLIPDDDAIPHRALRHVALSRGLCERADIEGGWKLPVEAYNDALDTVEDEYGLEPGREHIDGGVSGTGARQYDPETCVPPEFDPEPFDREAYRERLRGERYEAFLDATGPHVQADPAGSGKSTNAVLGADERDREYFAAFDKHEKARETITDDVTPSNQFHLMGGEQPIHPCCMDAAAATDEGETPDCPEHGRPTDWGKMCPIYQRGKDDDLRRRYEALVGPLGTLGAHLKLGLFDGEEHPWHGGTCRWADQFDELLDDEGRPLVERVAGVHEYQLLKSATEGRDVIVDESPRTLTSEQRVTVDDLVHAQVRLEELAEIQPRTAAVGYNLRTFAEFADDLVRVIASNDPGAFDDLDAPELIWDAYESYGDVAGNYLEKVEPSEPWHVAEALAQTKLEYNEGLVRKIEDGEVPSAPFCIDALLAAAAKAGLDTGAVRRAVAVPPILDGCPWCGSGLDYENGARICASEECDWDERENTVTRQDGERARASAWLHDDPDDLDNGERPALVFGKVPAVEDLPDDPLVLDATATPEKVAGLYGTPLDDVEVTGDDPLDLDGRLNVTQVLDGQYHAQTIRDTESLQERIQSVVDTSGELYDKPLFGIRRDLIPLFDFPENGEVLVYGGARGLNRTECDAVVCIGAPHPDMDEIQRTAELLSMGRDDLRAGGEEYSTRRNAPNPPIYRKLLYEDENGTGLAVPTKAYSGVAGALFREAREKEIEQFVHRIRPLLVEGDEAAKDAYLLTNVPTDLPVDDVVEFDELAGDLSAVFPVPEGALRLLGYGRDVLEGDAPDGFRNNAPIEARPGRALVEVRDDGTIANKAKGWHRLARMNGEDVSLRTIYDWLDALEAVGLLTPEKYEQHAGVSYAADTSTLKSALQILSCNGGFKVAAVRRFAEKVRGGDGGLDWLAWAEAVFDLSGDRCGWDPPPAPDG